MPEPQPEITPALTPQEWREGHADWGCDQYGQRRGCVYRLGAAVEPGLADGGLGVEELAPDGTSFADTYGTVDVPPNGWHKLAALALYNMPFGFTWEMAEALQFFVNVGKRMGAGTPTIDRALDAIDRIVALLPPRNVDK